MFSLNGMSFSGFKSEEEARKMMPEILTEMALSGYDTTKGPFQHDAEYLQNKKKNRRRDAPGFFDV